MREKERQKAHLEGGPVPARARRAWSRGYLLGRSPLFFSPSWNVVGWLRRRVYGHAELEDAKGQRQTTPWSVSAASQKQPDLRRFERCGDTGRRSMALAADGAASARWLVPRICGVGGGSLVSYLTLPSASIRPEPAMCTLGEYRPNLTLTCQVYTRLASRAASLLIGHHTLAPLAHFARAARSECMVKSTARCSPAWP